MYSEKTLCIKCLGGFYVYLCKITNYVTEVPTSVKSPFSSGYGIEKR